MTSAVIRLRGVIRRLDHRIVLVTLALALLGVLFIASVTADLESDEAGAGAGAKQVKWLLLGVLGVAVVLAVPYDWIVERAYVLYGLGILALIAVLVFGKTKNGSTRWFSLGLMDLQPSEFFKIILIVTLARYIRFRKSQRTFKGLGGPFLLTLVPMALILKQPDLGTSLLLLPILFAMVFVAGARARHLFLIVVVGLGAMVPVYHLALKDYQRKRIDVFLPFGDPPSVRQQRAEHYHAMQSAIAVGSGGIAGKGLDTPTRVHVPEPETDFIFTTIAERWGFLGVSLVFLLQGALLVLLTDLSIRTREPSGKLLVVGVLALFGGQFLVNVGMTVGLAPITGLTLPFVSYGGSSLLSSLLAIGFILNVGLRPGFVLARRDFGD